MDLVCVHISYLSTCFVRLLLLTLCSPLGMCWINQSVFYIKGFNGVTLISVVQNVVGSKLTQGSSF